MDYGLWSVDNGFMKLSERIGVLGVGNMGAAILEGLFKKKIAQPSQVWVCDKIQEKAAQFAKQWKTKTVPYSAGLVNLTDIILLAVKPQDLQELGPGLKSNLNKKHSVISILAGTPLAKIKEVVGAKPSLVRAMPNLGAKVGEAITALTSASPASLALAEKIFSGCGKTVILEENFFDLVTAISGSGPAYFFLLMELLAKEGEAHGLPENVARELAVQTAVGAGLLAKQSEFSPAELRTQVTSKGGTTEAALKVFEEKGLHEIISLGIKAALKRGKELSQ